VERWSGSQNLYATTFVNPTLGKKMLSNVELQAYPINDLAHLLSLLEALCSAWHCSRIRFDQLEPLAISEGEFRRGFEESS
jgi:hypothetical protein